MIGFRLQVLPVCRTGPLLLAVALGAAGCGAPSEVDRDNRRLVDAILTAITMKNTNWLEDDAARAETRNSEGQLSDEDYEQLLSIIEVARTGDWPSAEKLGYEFRAARPFVQDGR
jgi:hypothetical protein